MTTTLRVASHGVFLATRAFARTIRGLAEDELAVGVEPLALDFTGVEAITGGVADELVVQLALEYGERVCVVGANAEVAETIALALKRREIRVHLN